MIVLLLVTAAPARAVDRFALVIGNQAYTDKVGPLRNPHNDIAVVGKALGEVGFKVLPPRKDASRDDILFAVHNLAAQVRTAGNNAVSFLYYAGHGVGVGGDNVLIPTNAEDTTDAMLRVRGVRLGEILDILRQEAPDAAHFVVLDACRNNLRGQRGARGFVAVDDRRTGVVIAFSTAPGETATDDGARSGPYAVALAEEIIKPGRNDLEVFNAVRVRVRSATRGQTPWTHDGLVSLERVVFKATGVQSPPAAPPPPSTYQQPRLSEAAEAWSVAKDTTSTATLEAFVRRFGDTFYGDLARGRLAELKQVEVATQAAEQAKKKADDEARVKAEAERQRQAMLQQEEERKRAEAEAARKKAESDRRRESELAPGINPAPFRLSKTRTIRLQSAYPSSIRQVTSPLDELARELSALAQGTLKVDAHPAGAIVPAFETLDAVSREVVDAGWSTPTYWSGKSQAAIVLGGHLPFGLDAQTFVRWMDAAGGALLNELYGQQLRLNLHALPCGLLGRGGDWYRKPMQSPADLRGVKIRGTGIAQKISERAGLQALLLAGGEIVPAIDRGVLEATMWGTPAMDAQLGLQTVLKFMHFPSWSRPLTVLELLINAKTWQALGADGQTSVARLCSQHLRRALQGLDSQEAQGLDELRRAGVNIAPYPAAVLAHFKSATTEELAEMRKDPFTAKVLASYDSFR